MNSNAQAMSALQQDRDAWKARAEDMLDTLESLRERLLECSKDTNISAADAYDSFYQDLVDGSIARTRSQS